MYKLGQYGARMMLLVTGSSLTWTDQYNMKGNSTHFGCNFANFQNASDSLIFIRGAEENKLNRRKTTVSQKVKHFVACLNASHTQYCKRTYSTIYSFLTTGGGVV